MYVNVGVKEVVFNDPYLWPHKGPKIKFRLTYEGSLPSTQNGPRTGQADPRSVIKHKIRQAFHPQLSRLWTVNRNLTNPVTYQDMILSAEAGFPPNPTALAAKFAMFGWNFVPLVTEELGLSCALDILFLRPTPRTASSWYGDIDNRIKTLIDALQIPSANEGYTSKPASTSETPFFCLLENDKLLTRLTVETDEMLEPVGAGLKDEHVRLIITVEARPLFVSVTNLPFA